jgi:hypothetical protein
MTDGSDQFDNAARNLWDKQTLRFGERQLVIACLIRSADWRPLKAQWWRGKEVCIIGADLDGNFFLRHCDGTVRFWDHKELKDHVLSPSVRDFVRSLM